MVAVGLATWILGSGCGQVLGTRWNVVFLLLDTTRADRLGIYGSNSVLTRNIDRLGRDGVFFTTVRSQAACTYPSVNSILTSRYPSNFPIRGNWIGIPESIPALPEILKSYGYSTAAVSASPIVRMTGTEINPLGGFGRGFDAFDEECRAGKADCVNKQAFAHLTRLREPFLLYLHYMDPHGPYRPPWRYRRLYTQGLKAKRFAASGSPRGIAKMLYRHGPHIDVSPADVAMLKGLYDGELTYLDSSLGRLFDHLAQMGVAERTLIVLAADHGEAFLEHEDIAHCHCLYDSVLRTPLILRIPEMGHVTVSQPVQNLDILPTLLDYLGLPWQDRRLDGRSLRTLIEGEPSVAVPNVAAQHTMRSYADGRYKLIYDISTKKELLYDLAADAGETSSLAETELEVMESRRRRVTEWLTETEGAFDSEEKVKMAEEAEEHLRAVGYLE